MDPLDAYFLHKEAGFWDNFKAGRGVGGDVRTALVGVGVTAAAAAAVPAANKLIGAITKRHDFNNMMRHNPDLQEAQASDPRRFNQTYSSLRTMNPEFAKDPLVAGGLMGKMMTDPMVTPNVLMEASRARQFPGLSPMQGAMISGVQKSPFGRPADPYAEQKQQLEGHDIQKKMHGMQQEKKQLKFNF